MRYGEGYWNVENGVRLAERTYPSTRGFEYRAVDPADTTGDCGEWLTKNWCFDYVPPGTSEALRFTIMGNDKPALHENAFDFDWASIPALLRGPLTCDKADYRIRAGCLPHDIGFCVHEFWPEFTREFWNRMLFETMEAYSVTMDEVNAAPANKRQLMLARYMRDKALRYKVLAGVTVGGPFAWKKTPEEIAMYSKMLKVERVLDYKGFTI